MNKIIISVAMVEDREQVAEVIDNTWLTTYPNAEHGITHDDIINHIEKWKIERSKRQGDRIKNPPKGETLLVAKDGDKVVGICRVNIREDRNFLTAMYVLQSHQGKGIGKKFWLEAQKYTDPNKDFYLELATYNKNALEFYKKLGFEDTGKRFNDEKMRMKSDSIIPEMEMVLKR